jgi:hypothetical protein
MKTKTIFDYPPLIEKLVRQAALREIRRQRWGAFFKIGKLRQKH